MLYIVSTPIGNLGDLSPRAAETLARADLVAAEDTRHTGALLHSLGIKKPMVSLHDHNEASRVEGLIGRMEKGETLALVSDAGTPLISDPGYRLVRACIGRGIPVVPLPGPSAVTAALAASGLPPQPFYFGGFLPVKPGPRASELRQAIGRGITHIYFESPHRLLKSLEALAEIAPGSFACVAREISKKFEEFRRGAPGELLDAWNEKPPKGEITLLFHPSPGGHPPE